MISQLILQFILILINAFFAATEIALISLNDKKLKVRADSGDKKAAKMLKMIEEPTRFLSTIQIGITLAGFLGSAFAADNFAQRLAEVMIRVFGLSADGAAVAHSVSVVAITLILSFFTLVLGELVPKRLAMKHKDKLAEAVCGSISTLAFVLRPIIWLLTVSTNVVLRMFGIDPYEKEDPVSEEDIVLMLDAGGDEGSLDKDDIEYIKNVFRLSELTAGDIMTPRRLLALIEDGSTPAQIAQIIEQEGYSRIPVYSQTPDNIIGVLHTRNYLIKCAAGAEDAFASSLLKPVFVPESVHLDALLSKMQKEHLHIVTVVNEYGETAGVVTMEDILEELVGEIWDESDDAFEDFRKLPDGSCRVLCSASAEEFFEVFELEEESEAATVNGWLTEILGTIPVAGYCFEHRHLSVSVTKADEHMAHEINVKTNQKVE